MDLLRSSSGPSDWDGHIRECHSHSYHKESRVGKWPDTGSLEQSETWAFVSQRLLVHWPHYLKLWPRLIQASTTVTVLASQVHFKLVGPHWTYPKNKHDCKGLNDHHFTKKQMSAWNAGKTIRNYYKVYLGKQRRSKWVPTCKDRNYFTKKKKRKKKKGSPEFPFSYTTNDFVIYHITSSKSLKWLVTMTVAINTWKPSERWNSFLRDPELYYRGMERIRDETINRLLYDHRWITLLHFLWLLLIFDSGCKIVRWPTYAKSQETVYRARDKQDT